MTPAPRGQSLHPLPSGDPDDLGRFPQRSVHGTWFRAHVDRGGRDGGCWWFSSVPTDPDAGGRFDLPGPDGTCYLAGDPLSALLELIGPDLESGAVSADFLHERRLREL